eukprot:CAMPEP_0181223182 /NCGR_PEP_ID=MMETSP1096-20121128/30370_1 /TAXON_ID=156174 ORGANISM="Chrysochromulina ericina, Strain CCMP281" /NCGR_SAMPLE_ID=MMETSP1096 /ASSEMBLY_ACC=CAM_ASM_000453 /LENGTH=93 /DNA_ID=CAMNT_0023316007 /DNA_START=700 /DNA_END=981 /DNA_ORIENTATION=+
MAVGSVCRWARPYQGVRSTPHLAGVNDMVFQSKLMVPGVVLTGGTLDTRELAGAGASDLSQWPPFLSTASEFPSPWKVGGTHVDRGILLKSGD